MNKKQKDELIKMFASVTATNAYELMNLINTPNFINFKSELDVKDETYELDFKFKKIN